MAMESLEKKYYEASCFWEEGVFDEANIERIDITIGMIPPEVKTLLDAGCGNGLFLNTLLEKKPDIEACGFDRSEEALKYVKAQKKVGDMLQMDFADESFNCVTCLEVIEHLPVPVYKQALSELARVSKKYLLISVPYNEDLSETFTQCPQCQSLFNANLHLRSYSQEIFKKLFLDYGYTCRNFVLAGKSTRYKFHNRYRKLFYPSQFRRWLSPLCPICGYEETASSSKHDTATSLKTNTVQAGISVFSILKSIPKALWPKEDKYYWIIGLFEKGN
jgi:SAM-dependent methyltransferase